MSEIRDHNIGAASTVSRDIDYQINGILSDIRVFANYLESLGEDIEGQASALLTLRLSSPQRYYAAYYFDENNGLMIHLADSLGSLQTMEDFSTIVTRLN